MNKLSVVGILASLFIQVVASQGSCTSVKGLCTQTSPCCGSAGYCGNGFNYCGEGCSEPNNYKGAKCYPPPSCRSGSFGFSKDNTQIHKDYKGDHKKIDFTVEGEAYELQGNEIVLKMSKAKSGTALKSTRYINYGRISAEMKTSRGAGVVSYFITMSDVKDEIDFEWIGNNLNEAQTNMFRLGKLEYTHGAKHNQSDSFNEWHTYTIDWKPESITWSVDGGVIRVLTKEDDEFPQTPSKFSFGLWDGGSGEEGTRTWAGGYVDWESQDMKTQGYYSVRIRKFSVECYGAPTSKDEDFEINDKYGLVPKGSIKPPSRNRTSDVPEGTEDMFDVDSEGSDGKGKTSTNVITQRPVGSYSFMLSIPVSSILLSFLGYLIL